MTSPTATLLLALLDAAAASPVFGLGSFDMVRLTSGESASIRGTMRGGEIAAGGSTKPELAEIV